MTVMPVAPTIADVAGRTFDLLVVGGGIVGAGIFREAARAGIRVLLVEQGDFASGTSSRSSQLVHGGLHYLSRMQLRLAAESIKGRNHLLRTESRVVQPIECVIPRFPQDRLPPLAVTAALDVYDAIGGRWTHHAALPGTDLRVNMPDLAPQLEGGHRYQDATTDDASLVLSVIRDGVAAGGIAFNYTRAEQLERDARGRIASAVIRDVDSLETVDVRFERIVNATGAWADSLRGQLGLDRRVRWIRGSHLVFPESRLPVQEALISRHPENRQPLYILPWQGVTVVGSTSVEHDGDIDTPRISDVEARYLLSAAQRFFPARELHEGDVLSSYSGIRAILDDATADPGQASREGVYLSESGLITVTGGKLTTFVQTSRQALRRAGLPVRGRSSRHAPVMPPHRNGYADPLESLLRSVIQDGRVRHLDDVLLRRTRLGLSAPDLIAQREDLLARVTAETLGWDAVRWAAERERYERIRTTGFSSPFPRSDKSIAAS